ncbi:unnamed protein product, partial [Iphiclides podalirius]
MTKPRTRRQSRRHSAYFDPAEDDSSSPPTATGNISINDMAAMMSTWQRNQEETFEKLLHTVLNHSQRSSPPRPLNLHMETSPRARLATAERRTNHLTDL